MKQIIFHKNTSERIINNKNNILELDYKNSITIINNIFLDNSSNIQYSSEFKFIKKELENKIRGYKNQDIKKSIYDENKLITYNDLLEKLVISKLKCYYCNDAVKLIYKICRDPNQWTLDRLNNDLCHSKENTIICCLKCNLKRRNIDSNKFNFTKKLNLNKIE